MLNDASQEIKDKIFQQNMAVEVAKDQLCHGTISINVTGLASPHTKSNLQFFQKQIVPLSAFIRNQQVCFLCVSISQTLCKYKQVYRGKYDWKA